MEFEVEVRHIAMLDQWPGSEETGNPVDQWSFTINGQHVDYYTGIGHRKKLRVFSNCPDYPYVYAKGKPIHIRDALGHLKYTPQVRKILLGYTAPLEPALDDVLHSLVLDSEAGKESFEDWCSDFGYDTDSRRAMDTYLKCQESGKKLVAMGIDIDRARELFQDY